MIAAALLEASGAAAQVSGGRRIDGTGNNIQDFTLGASVSPLIRLTPETYVDGASQMIVSPNARAVSNAVGTQTAPTEYNPLRLSSMFWQWGQFLDHDMSLSIQIEHQVYDIAVPAGDPNFFPGDTIPLHRSNFAAGTGTTSPRQYANFVTHWIDGSMVYGSEQTRADALRTFAGGRLATGADGFMRRNHDAASNGLPNGNETGFYPDAEMFLAGDVRANENPGLTALHEVFVRQHNQLVDGFAADNPAWTDEQLYQTARKIIGAQIQKITYEDWLPLMLGDGALPAYAGYDNTVDPSLSIDFTTAAFRFGHTMLNEQLLRVNADRTEFAGGHLDLSQAFFNPNLVSEPGGMDALLRGLIVQPANDLDTQVIDDVRSMLFGPPGAGGLDLLALNIQRGRDHGIGTLNDLRVALGLSPHADFAALTSDATLAAGLASVYADVDEVDAWIGLMAEDDAQGLMLGETLRLAIADQFARLRDGDRYFYLNDPQLTPYLDLVNGIELCDIIAAVTGVTEFKYDVFRTGARPAIPEPALAAALFAALGGVRRRKMRR